MAPLTTRRPILLTLVERNDLTWSGLRCMLEPYDDIRLVPRDARGVLARGVDVTMLDSCDPPTAERVSRLAERPFGGKLVLFGWNQSQADVRTALAAGARGSLPKSLPADVLVSSLRRIVAGEVVVLRRQTSSSHEPDEAGLTARETQIVNLIATGLSNDEIAALTQLSINSVKSYIRAAYRKMGVTSRSQAVLWAFSSGSVEAPVGRSA